MEHVIQSRNIPDLYIPENVSLGEFIFRDVPIYNDRIAMIDGVTGEKYTFRELLVCIRKLANTLNRRGIQKGDVILFLSTNNVNVSIAFLTLVCMGCTVTTMNPLSTENDVYERCQDAQIKAAFVLEEFLPKLETALSKYGRIKGLFMFDRGVRGHPTLHDLIQEGHDVDLPRVRIDPKKDLAMLPYSSGTSGKPKGVMISHYGVLAGLIMLGVPELSLEGRPGSTLLLFVPNFHAYGLLVILYSVMRANTVVTLPKYTLEATLSCIEKYRVNCLPLVPAVAVELAKSPLVDQYDLSSLEVIHSNAAPMGIELTNKVKERIKVDIRQAYGQTEVPGAITMAPIRNYKDGASGQVYPNSKIKIIDPDSGKALGPNERGEICVKSTNQMLGYLKRPEATSNTVDDDGYVHTGDIGYYDEDEYFYVVDRLKELIKYKGMQVPPASLEDLLLRHPAVGDVCVVGRPDEAAGELPMAFIVKKDGVAVNEEQIVDYVNKQVAPYMKLRGGVEFTDAIPKSPNGKILRRVLRDRLATELKAKSKL